MRLLILLSLAVITAARYVEVGREKRNIEYHEWLKPDQKAELKALHESADAAALKKRTMELYELLPAEEKEKWNGKYKEMCVAWIKEIATAEETENYKKWKTEGKMDEIKSQYNKLKDRLSADKRKDVELWEGECWDLWKSEFPASRGRRNVMDLAEDKLAFLGKDKIAELKALKESGATDDIIRDKVVSWTLEHWKSKDSTASTADFVKKCYGWIKDVTSASEYEEFEKLHHVDHEACRVKVREFVTRLPADQKEKVEKSLPLCDAIWYKQHQEEHGGHDHHAHKHHAKRRHLNTMHIKQYMAWLTPEQKAEIEKLEAGGESYENLVTKMKEYYGDLAPADRKEVRSEIKGLCSKWVFEKATETEKEDLMDFIKEGNKEGLMETLKKPYGRLSEEEKHEVDHTKDLCLAVWTTSPDYRKRRDHHGDHHHEEYKEYFSWLTPEQGAELKTLREAGNTEAVYQKVDAFYAALSGDKKNEATEKLKGACKHFFKSTFGAAAVEEIKTLKESGTPVDDITKKVEELISQIEDNQKKAVAARASANCKKIFAISRKRRDHHGDHHEEYKEYFSWLTPEQGEEIKTLREAGNQEGVYQKMEEYYGALSGDKKTEATEKLKGGCKHFFTKAFGADAVAEIKAMKESGSSMDDIAKKVEGFISKITDEKKKAVATRASVNCKKVFSASRKRRDHHDEHEEYKQYFTWLTPEQRAEVKVLKEAGNEEAIAEKVDGYYASLTGDKKNEATEKLKGACKHFFNSAFGAAAVEEIKTLKESGAPVDEIAKKVEEFISKITDEKKKATAARASVNCKKIFSASRKRRDHHGDHGEYKEYFSWLTPAQRSEIKALKEAGNEDGVFEKIDEFYNALSGDEKTEATGKLKGACKHEFTKILGTEAVEVLTAMKESGLSSEAIGAKAMTWIDGMKDEPKLHASAMRAFNNCKKVFGASRKRRDQHKHTMEEAVTEFLPWLTDAQKAELKSLKESGADDKMGEKIMEYYDSVDASKKADATTKLQAGCKHFIAHLIGESSAAEMKALKESGASNDDMAKKLEEIIGKMADGVEKKKAIGMTKNCKRVFGVVSRKRRDQHKHTMEEAVTEFLPWLTDAQKAELKSLKESGADDKMGEKIMEYYDTVDASKKAEATTKLQAGCKHFIAHLIGESSAAEMKALKESGASNDDMAKKLEEIIGKMADGVEKKKAIGMTKNCKRVFGVAARKRRDQHEHTLEESFTQFLPWITEEQKMELKNMKEAGAQDKIGEKVMEYYNSVDESKKGEATIKLQAGCRHFLKHLLGDSVSGEMKTMHESGASPVEMAKKLDEIIGEMEDGEKKTKALALSKNCRKVYGVTARKRRTTYGEFDERYHQYYNWLSEEQRVELEDLNESGKDEEFLEAVSKFFGGLDGAKLDEARGQLKMGCRMRMRDLLGEDKTEEIRHMKDEGASRAAMMDKVAQFVETMEEGAEKESARRSYRHCAKILSRHRRESEQKKSFGEYLSWLKPEQKEELNELMRSDPEAIYGKLFDFLNQLSGQERVEATTHMRGACRHFMTTFLGEQQGKKLRQMKENGKQWSEIEQTLDGMLSAIEDEKVRSKATAAIGNCKQFWRK